MALEVGTNTYLTVEDADNYFSGRLNAMAWDGADEATREKALISAARVIDRQPLRGLPVHGQTMAFPRAGEYEVADAVKRAQCEQALFLLEQDSFDRQRERLKAAGVKSKSVGGASESFAGGPNYLAPEAREYLRPWLASVVSIG